jgi:hypothetical protein
MNQAQPRAQVIGQPPANVDLLVYQGDDFFLDVTVVDVATGHPYPLDGYTAASQIRATPPSAEVLADLVPVIDGNVIHLHLVSGESARLVTRCAWDVQITNPDGFITTLVYGLVSVTAEVTRPAVRVLQEVIRR